MSNYFIYDRDFDPYDYSMKPRNMNAHFDELMHNEFGGKYEIQRNVPAKVFIRENTPECPPLSYVMLQDGKPVAAVILAKDGCDKTIRFANTKKVCEAVGIPCIRFYTSMPNVRDYVVDRIHWYLNQIG